MPLIVTVIDECHTFFDIEAAKGDRRQNLSCGQRGMTGQLVRKRRSVLFPDHRHHAGADQ